MKKSTTTDQHSSKTIHEALRKADVAAVATHEGLHIKQRQMHYAVDDNLDLYFATMKGDPKTLQITSDPEVSILILDRTGDMEGWSETEFSGSMEIITGDKEKKKASRMLYTRSPIVKNLVDYKQDHILEWIKLTPKTLKFRIFGEIVQGMAPTIKSFETSKFSLSEDLKAVKKRILVWYKASRAQFLTASVLPVLLGISIAHYQGTPIKFQLAFLTLLAGCFLHVGANLFNDYFDHLGGSDAENTEFSRPFTGGSRVIQLGLLTPATILLSASISTILGLIIGVYLAFTAGSLIWLLGLIGLIVVLAYSLPKYGLASLGLGEISIGFIFGPLMALGAYYVQTGHINHAAVYASVPLGLLLSLLLFINEFPDSRADKKVGKNNLVVRMGLSRASNVYILLGISVFIVMSYLVLSKRLPPSSWAALLGLPFIIWGWSNAKKYLKEPKQLTPSCAATVSAHVTVGVAIILSFLVGGTAIVQLGVWIPVIVGFMLLTAYIDRKKRAFSQAQKTFQR
jgi:1,4-dihydroxy-2-naphthoate octaprenyltransferase